MANSRTRRKAMDTDERHAKITALKARLDEWEEEADESLLAEIIARFDGYSERNAKLIAMQCPGATHVEGFRRWLDLGRCVRKGEHGIQILAPAGTSKPDQMPEGQERIVAGWTAPDADPSAPGVEGGSGKPRQFFRLTFVFDVSQTDELPAQATA